MFVLALDHSSLFPAVTNLRVGINVLKNYWRPRVTILQCGLCCPARRLGDTAIPGADQAACLGQDQRGAVTADHGRGSSALPLSTCPGEWSLPLCPWGLGTQEVRVLSD